MKHRKNLILALVIIFTTLSSYAKDKVYVSPIETFSTETPSESINFNVTKNAKLGEYELSENDILHCNVIKVTKPNFSIYEIVVKPIISAAVMGIAVFAVNGVLTHFLGISRLAAIICMAVGIGIGGIIYLVMLFVTETLKEEEIRELPKGEKIVEVLSEIGLIKRLKD